MSDRSTPGAEPPDDDHGRVTAAELDRERLAMYVATGTAPTVWWYWPAYGLLVALWLSAYDLDSRVAHIVAPLVFAGAIGFLAGDLQRRAGVSTPRFVGMPTPLKRAYLPVVAAAIVFVAGALVRLWVGGGVPWSVVGIVIGAGTAAAGAWSERRYRRAASELARDAGLEP